MPTNKRPSQSALLQILLICSMNTMPKVKKIPEAIRKQLVKLRNEGLTYRQIAEGVKVKYSIVGALVRKHRETGAVSNLYIVLLFV